MGGLDGLHVIQVKRADSALKHEPSSRHPPLSQCVRLTVKTYPQVAAGGTHTMALTSEGRIFVWGRASYGRLGLGNMVKSDQYLPVECQLPGECGGGIEKEEESRKYPDV